MTFLRIDITNSQKTSLKTYMLKVSFGSILDVAVDVTLSTIGKIDSSELWKQITSQKFWVVLKTLKNKNSRAQETLKIS